MHPGIRKALETTKKYVQLLKKVELLKASALTNVEHPLHVAKYPFWHRTVYYKGPAKK